jgi:hypothetical protein
MLKLSVEAIFFDAMEVLLVDANADGVKCAR